LNTQKANNSSDYELNSSGSFTVRDYGRKKPFSNFLPGIAGLYGTPMWVFYVNRGQAVASFGTRNKDGSILEFFPANKAYQMVSSIGFRTFVKWKPAGASSDKYAFYEPFHESSLAHTSTRQAMEVSSHELVIRDRAIHPALETEVVYFTIPGEPIAALARQVTFTNHSSQALDLEVLDGLPQANPYGMNEFFMKQMSRTIEAWMTVENLEKNAPFLKLKVDATDRPEVTMVEGGNFYTALSAGRKPQALETFVDPAVVFGASLDYAVPQLFFQGADFKGAAKQVRENKTPCVFGFSKIRLAPGASKTIYSLVGHARSSEALNRYLLRARKGGYFEAKREENRRLIQALKSPIFTVSSSAAYDAYCGQTYLDNMLRGGMPLCLGDSKKPLVYYVYSRKHGDLERDYNRFLVEDTYFAQGDGNYRDVNQNRRSDVWFEPRVGDANLKTFMNLLQLDGFNPLVVKGCELHFHRTAGGRHILSRHFGPKKASEIETYLLKPFKIGAFYRWLEEKGWARPASFGKLMNELAGELSLEEKAEHGEGFWVDHWTYNLDLLEGYLAIYPEKLREALLGKREYTFYDNAHHVRPRSAKYHLLKGKQVRQYGSVLNDKEKAARIESRDKEKNWSRVRQGKGDVYRTTLLSKLVCLFVNKLASIDADGTGIEMEADKPSWYDALNGLPGLAGSSLCETFELKRLAVLIGQCLEALGVEAADSVLLPEEVAVFVSKMDDLLRDSLRRGSGAKPLAFWEEATSLKEKYRAAVVNGVSGAERRVGLEFLRTFLERGREKVDLGIEKAFDAKRGLYPTYFQNEVIRHAASRGKTGSVVPLAFRQEAIPYFLESNVHAMKVEKDPARRKALYNAVRRSALFDAKLGMYKVNEPMAPASLEVGRARVFTPGWLENESIWLHMEYKYLLEVLKAGMHEEFFHDFRKALVPFQPPERYGRSLMENSSFIVSSVFPDASLHGTGFVARLSGSTAEFLQMWLLMNVGKRPFVLGPDGKVSLRFEPHLPASLFTEKATVRVYIDKKGEEQAIKLPPNSFAFLFLGKTLVVYTNNRRLDTFGKQRSSVRRIRLQDRAGRWTEFKGDTVPSPYSLRVRDEFIPRIEVELA